jgi:hypothetical protein
MSTEPVSSQGNTLDSDVLQPDSTGGDGKRAWQKLGWVAAASAFAGGLAVAWWYRKTLTKLRESEESTQNTQFGISDDSPSSKEPPFDL